MLNTDEKKEEKEDKNYEFGQNQLGDLDKKLNDEVFSVKIIVVSIHSNLNIQKISLHFCITSIKECFGVRQAYETIYKR